MNRLSAALLLALLTLLFLFHEAWLGSLAAWSLHLYSTSKWGEPLRYEKLHFTGSHLLILEPRLGEGPLFTAKQLEASLAFDWRRGLFHLDVVVEEPCCSPALPLAKPKEDWKKLWKRHSAWMKIHSTLCLRNGSLLWGLEEGEPECLYFDVDLDSRRGGSALLSFISKGKKSGTILLRAASLKDLEVSCQCQKVSCASLLALTRLLGARPLPIAASGSLQGELKAFFPSTDPPLIEGELRLDQALFSLPDAGWSAEIGQARLTLQPCPTAEGPDSGGAPVHIRLDLLEPAALSSSRNGGMIEQIEGMLLLENLHSALIDLRGKWSGTLAPLFWKLRGEAGFEEGKGLNGEFTLASLSPDGKEGRICLSWSSMTHNRHLAKIQFDPISQEEFRLLQLLFGRCWPKLNQIEVLQGICRASIEMEIAERLIKKIDVKQFQALHSRARLRPWRADLNFARLEGSGRIDLSLQGTTPSLVEAKAHLEDGSLSSSSSAGVGINVEDPSLSLAGIQSDLSIQKGALEHSLTTFRLVPRAISLECVEVPDGLKGKMDVEWGGGKRLLMFQLEGTGTELAKILPPPLQRGVQSGFASDRIAFAANLMEKKGQWDAEGTLQVQRGDGGGVDLVHFGCAWKRNRSHPIAEYTPHGWFYARSLPLERFLSPFIFKERSAALRGTAEIKGSFEGNQVFLKYTTGPLRLENEALVVDIPAPPPSRPGELVGSHYIDLQEGSHHGSLPVCDASCLLYPNKSKNEGLSLRPNTDSSTRLGAQESPLSFEGIRGLLVFNPDSVSMKRLETYCEGIYCSGEWNLDYSDPAPGVFDLSVRAPIFSGKILQFQRLMAHLPRGSLAEQIPLEGTVEGRKKGLEMFFHFIPGDYHLNAHFQGAISDGYLPLEKTGLALRGLHMNVEYGHQERLLEFTEVHGALLIGKPQRVQEYPLLGRHFRLYCAKEPNLAWDLALHDREREVIRLAGCTISEGQGVNKVQLDSSLSHISSLYPALWECRIKEWAKIERLECRAEFDLNLFLRDLQRFRHTGLPFLSPRLLERVAPPFSVQGRGSLKLSCRPGEGWGCELEGWPIPCDSPIPHHFLLKGAQRGRKWIIDPFQWDEWHAYVELQESETKWKIPFLGLRMGKTLLLGAQGEFSPGEERGQGKVDFCEIDLAQLGEAAAIPAWSLSGRLKATGELEWAGAFPSPLGGVAASLRAEVEKAAWEGIPLCVPNPFRIAYQPDGAFRLEQLTFSLCSTPECIPHKLEWLECRASSDDKLHFSLCSQYARCPFQAMGFLSWPALREGQCTFLNLEGPCFRISPLRLKWEYSPQKGFSMRSLQGEFSGWNVSLEAISPDKLKNLDLDLAGTPRFDHLKMDAHCPIDPFPDLASLERALQPNTDSSVCLQIPSPPLERGWSLLKGEVAGDLNDLTPLLDPSIIDAIQQAGLGSPYRFTGIYRLRAAPDQPLWTSLTFKGKLSSDETLLGNYRLERLRAHLEYTPGNLHIHDLSIEDPAGSLQSESITHTWDGRRGRWKFYVPSLKVKNFRPSRLREALPTSPLPQEKLRSLTLKKLEINELSGVLSDRKSWLANGSLQFLNPSRKIFFHPILAIPAEIILRLGLDPHVLNPVTGTIQFQLQRERFYLTRFKDVYSEGRGSKFYLAPGNEPSWMDFDGNLSVHVRMKQYNLLFKIAELFTVSITGSLAKPQYALRKQAKSSQNEANKF